jgi:hypothetical protein
VNTGPSGRGCARRQKGRRPFRCGQAGHDAGEPPRPVVPAPDERQLQGRPPPLPLLGGMRRQPGRTSPGRKRPRPAPTRTDAFWPARRKLGGSPPCRDPPRTAEETTLLPTSASRMAVTTSGSPAQPTGKSRNRCQTPFALQASFPKAGQRRASVGMGVMASPKRAPVSFGPGGAGVGFDVTWVSAVGSVSTRLTPRAESGCHEGAYE